MFRVAQLGKVGFVSVLAAALLMPLALFAQPTAEDDARLRAEIRSALLSDPRSQDLSEEELNGLIGAIAEEAEEQGLVDDYIPPEPTFAVWYGEVAGYNFFGYSVSEAVLYGIILLALGLAIVLLRRIFTMHHRDMSPPAAPSAPVQPPTPPSAPPAL